MQQGARSLGFMERLETSIQETYNSRPEDAEQMLNLIRRISGSYCSSFSLVIWISFLFDLAVRIGIDLILLYFIFALLKDEEFSV